MKTLVQKLQNLKIAVLTICLCAINLAANADWQFSENYGLSTGPATFTKIAFDYTSGNRYIAYGDYNNGGRLVVFQYDATNHEWTVMDPTGLSTGEVKDVALTVDNVGHVFIAYIDGGNGDMVYVKEWDGNGSWVNLGTNGLVNDYWSTSIDLAAEDNVPYIAFNMHDNALGNILYVSKFDGTSWVRIGNRLTNAYVNNVSIALKDHNPWVAYTDYNYDNSACVKYYDGTTWNTFNYVSATEAAYTTIKVDGKGTPYVGYRNLYDGNPVVMAYDGSSWNAVAAVDPNGTNSGNNRLAVDNTGSLYITYTDYSNGWSITARRLEGDVWNPLSTPNATGGPADNGTLCFDQYNNAYLCFNDIMARVNIIENSYHGNPAIFGNGVWNVYTWENTDWTTGYMGFYTDTNLTYNTYRYWDSSYDPSHASTYIGDEPSSYLYSYAAKREGFPLGYYTLNIPHHMDDVYLYVNGDLVFSHIGAGDSHADVWEGILNDTSKIEFRIAKIIGGESHGELEFVPAPFSASASAPAISCAGGNTVVTVTGIGGTAPYTGAGTFNVSAGTYNYTVHDAVGDSAVASITVNNPSPLTASISASGDTTFCQGGSVMLSLNKEQFVSSIIGFSSQYYNPPGSGNHDQEAIQVLGAPDMYPNYGTSPHAWTTYGNSNAGHQYLELGFNHPGQINFINIYETNNPGTVDTVYVMNPNTNNYEIVYSATAGWAGDSATRLHVTFPQTAFDVSQIRVALNTAAVTGWNEIDAVSIGNDSNQVLWSTGATTDAITVSTAGSYSVTLTSAAGCSATSAPTAVTVNPSPAAGISAAGATTFCQGGSVALSAASDNYALLFTGGTQRVILPFNSPETNYTYELRFKTSDPNSGFSSVRQGDWANSADRMLHLSGGNIHHYIWSSEDISSSGQNYADNQWHHVAVVVESGVGQRMYVDGVLVASGSKDVSNMTSDGVIELGANQDWSTNASIDDIRLWNVVKTHSEIQQIMNTDITGTPVGLIGNWKFNEGAGTSTINSVDSVAGTLESGADWIDNNTNTYAWSTNETTQGISVSSAGSYSVTVTNTLGCSATSAPASVTVNSIPTITGTTPASVCDGGEITIYATASSGSITWYEDSTTSFVSGTGSSFTTPYISTSAVYYVDATENDCTTPTRTAVAAIVSITPSFTSNPVNLSICGEGSQIQFNAPSADSGVTYRWSWLHPGDNQWIDFVNDANFSGADDSLLTINHAADSLSDLQIICWANSPYGCQNTISTQYHITSSDTITIQTQPVVQNLCGDKYNISLAVVATNAGTYQWQENDGSGYEDMSDAFPRTGVNSATLILYYPGDYGMSGHTFRCVTTGGQCTVSATSNEAGVYVHSLPGFTTAPYDVTACGLGGAVQFSALAADTSMTYQWKYFDNDSSSWVPVTNDATYSGVTGSTLAITGVNDQMNDQAYACFLTSPLGCENFAQATLTIGNTADTMIIDSQPTDYISCDYTNYITFNVGSPNATSYQWQQDDGSGFTNLDDDWPYSGVYDNMLEVYYPVDYNFNNYKYRCIALGSSACSLADTSNTVVFTVHNRFTHEVNDVTLCGNDNIAQFTALATDTIVTYQWQVYNFNTDEWDNLADSAIYSGTTTDSLTITGATPDLHENYYNCLVSSYGCSNNSYANLYLDATPFITANASTTQVCIGNQVTLWGDNGNGDGYIWSNGIIDGQPFIDSTTATFTVTGNDSYGCPAVDSITVLTHENTLQIPVVNAFGATSVCDGETVNLGASNTTTEFIWSNGVNSVPGIGVTTSGNYTVTNMDDYGCMKSSLPVDVYIPILPEPVINTGGSCNGNVTTVSGLKTYTIPNDYDPSSEVGYQTFIDGFDFAGINNANTGITINGNQTYSYTPSLMASVVQGTKYPFTIYPPAGSPNGFAVGVWIDLNNNGSFTDAGEMVYTIPNSVNNWIPGPFSDSLVVPASTLSGITRMRVRISRWTEYSSENDANRTDYGETEDYDIQIGSANPLQYVWTSSPAGYSAYYGATLPVIPNTDTTYILTVTDSILGCSKTTSIRMDSSMLLAPGSYSNNTWMASCYNGTDMDTYEGYYMETGLSFDSRDKWSMNLSPSAYSGYHGCPVGNDNHSVTYKRQGYPEGVYSIDIPGHDDNCFLYINDSLVFEHGGCCDSHTEVWTGVLDADTKVNFTWLEGGGESYGAVNFNFLYRTPIMHSISGASAFCKGASGVAYAVNDALGADYYVWSVPAGASIVSGDSTHAIVVDFAANVDSGIVSVYGVNNFGQGIISSYNVKVALPDSSIQASGSTIFCSGNSVELNAAGEAGFAMEFIDGGERWISIPMYSPLTNYTWELSFKTTDPNARLSSVHADDRGGDQDRFLFLSNGNIYHFLWSNEQIGSTGQNFADDQWHRVSVVVESGVGQKIYVDGILVATGSKDASDFYWNNTIDIGWYDGSFVGEMDNARLWNVPLTQAQVQQNMNSDIPVSSAGLVSNWTFNEGTGTESNSSVGGAIATLHDVSWTNHHSTAYLWSNGATTQGIEVNASGDYSVTITNSIGCSATSAPLSVLVNSLPAVSIDTLSAVGTCHTPINLNGGTPLGGTYTGTGVTNDQFDPSVGGGDYTITYSYTDNNGCSSIDSADITVVPLPSVSFSNLQAVGVCATAIALTGGSPSGGVYSGTGVNNGNFNPSVAGVGNKTLTYTYQDTYGCSNAATGDITVTAIPSIISTTPANRCDAGTVDLSATESTGTVSWFSDSTSGSSIATGNVFTTPSINATTIYFAEASENGCASTRTAVTATVNNAVANSQIVNLCSGEDITVGTHTYSASGNYTDVFTSASGCDSTVTTDLTVNSAVDITTTVAGHDIAANATSASYQWINCNNGNAIMPGQTGQHFIATFNGDYAVIVTVGNCSDTSDCVNITATGVDAILSNSSIGVYPNPNNGVFTVKSHGDVVYSILDELGQAVLKGILNSENNYTVDIKDLSNGVYYIVGYNTHSTTKQKIVVTK